MGQANEGGAPSDHAFRLTTETLQGRTTSAFPGAYLTLTSIIQAVALGLLANETAVIADETGIGWDVFLRILLIFMLLVLTTYHYIAILSLFRWAPDIVDTLIPFLLGSTEIWAIKRLNEPTYMWWGVAAFLALGCLGFLNSRARTAQDMFGPVRRRLGAGPYRLTIHLQQHTFWPTAIAFISLLGVALASQLANPSETLMALLACLSIVAAGVYTVCQTEYYIGQIFSPYGLPRRSLHTSGALNEIGRLFRRKPDD